MTTVVGAWVWVRRRHRASSSRGRAGWQVSELKLIMSRLEGYEKPLQVLHDVVGACCCCCPGGWQVFGLRWQRVRLPKGISTHGNNKISS